MLHEHARYADAFDAGSDPSIRGPLYDRCAETACERMLFERQDQVVARGESFEQRFVERPGEASVDDRRQPAIPAA